MNNPTTRTEQTPATASNGVSFLSISVEAGRSTERILSLIVSFIAHDKISKCPSDYRSERIVADAEVTPNEGLKDNRRSFTTFRMTAQWMADCGARLEIA